MHFHILSFEGPDPYAQAGGIATRVEGLARALADRWAQWMSRHHPGGVYDGEEGKRLEYTASLPPYLVRRAGHSTALRYAWPQIVQRELLPRVEVLLDRPVRDSLRS